MTVLPRRLRTAPSLGVLLAAILSFLGRHVMALETVIRITGVVLLAVAIGSYDWRLGVALLGVSLILATIELPRRKT